jgi:Spy/CpxP family protein refolding chaperone
MRRLGAILGSILIAGPIVASAQSTPGTLEQEAIRQLEQAKIEVEAIKQQHLEQALQEAQENLKLQERALAEAYTNGVGPLAYVGAPQVVTPFGVKTKGDLTIALDTGLQGTWWREPRWVKELNLTTDQQKKMDEAFRQNKIKLIDLTGALEKAELMLEPLVENVNPGDQAKILAQIDRVADARADLEKANARMLLAIREVLTQEQWSKLPQSKFGAKNNFLRIYKSGAQ